MRWAEPLARLTAGSNIEARMEMMPMTTSSSIKVKPGAANAWRCESGAGARSNLGRVRKSRNRRTICISNDIGHRKWPKGCKKLRFRYAWKFEPKAIFLNDPHNTHSFNLFGLRTFS